MPFLCTFTVPVWMQLHIKCSCQINVTRYSDETLQKSRLGVPLSRLPRACRVSDFDLCLKRTRLWDEKPLRGSASLTPREAPCAALPLAASERDDVMLELLRRAGMGFRRTSHYIFREAARASVWNDMQCVFSSAEMHLCHAHKKAQHITVHVQKECISITSGFHHPSPPSVIYAPRHCHLWTVFAHSRVYRRRWLFSNQ